MHEEELESRIATIERKQRSKSGFFIQFLLSPIAVLLIGAYFNYQIEEAKQEFQRLEIEVRQIEAAHNMLAELFSDVPQRAFIADRLMRRLVDQQLADEITEIVTGYYSDKLHSSLRSGTREDFEGAESIRAAAQAIGGTAANNIVRSAQEKIVFVVVGSYNQDRLVYAEGEAHRLINLGYPTEIYFTNRNIFAVTIGQYQYAEALTRAQAVVSTGVVREAFLALGDTFLERVFPVKEN